MMDDELSRDELLARRDAVRRRLREIQREQYAMLQRFPGLPLPKGFTRSEDGTVIPPWGVWCFAGDAPDDVSGLDGS